MLRNFLLFPIISIILFNITFKFQDKGYHVPNLHYLILSVLLALFGLTSLYTRRS